MQVSLLLHDGDALAAAEVAQRYPLHGPLLLRLGKALSKTQPAVAGDFYWRAAMDSFVRSAALSDYTNFVSQLKQASHLLPAQDWQTRIAALRATHAKKRKLMECLRAQGL